MHASLSDIKRLIKKEGTIEQNLALSKLGMDQA